jgi:Na+-transporting NADH:ubiquinone oxidoreductase subunit NqrB
MNSVLLQNKMSHLIGLGLGILVFFSTDPIFISRLTDDQKWWLHIAIGVATYVGVSTTPAGVGKKNA